MPRRGPAKTRKSEVDALYRDALIAKLINRSMKDGKKSVAQSQVYGAFEIMKEKAKEEPDKLFHKAMDIVRPTMEVRPRRVGGASYQVPMPVRGGRQESLAIRWIIMAARARDNSTYHTFAEKLAAELLDAINGEGGAVKKKQEMERVAEANRAFAHFKW